MAMTVIEAIGATVLVLALILGVRAFRSRAPVTFKNVDEERLVYGVAKWAQKQLDIKPGDPRLTYSLLLCSYSADFNWMGRIPVEELALLSPFIDLIIEGKGPP